MVDVPPRRKRGRPPMKEVVEVEKRQVGRPHKKNEVEDEVVEKRKLGRPPKVREGEQIVEDTPKRKPGRPRKKSTRMRMRLSWWSCLLMLS